MMRVLCTVFACILSLIGCAAATGYDASRYTDEPKAKADAAIDTEPLPPQPKRSIPDPRRPPVADAGP